MAIAGLGRYVRYVPLPVVEGFTLGIAVIIALQQVPSFLGQPAQQEGVIAAAGHALTQWFNHPQWAPVVIAGLVAVAILVSAKRHVRPSIPIALIAISVVTLIVWWQEIPAPTIGALPDHLPAPQLPEFSGVDLKALVMPAVAVAALAALESLLSATAADAMTVSNHHDPDRELFGQGIANLASPLFGGMPATAAIARTAVNVRTGARSRLAAVIHSVVLLVVVLALSWLVALIPLAALGGVLIATAVRMVDASNIRSLFQASRSDAVVFLVTFVATVVLDLATAVILGIIAAGGFALRHMARSAELTELDVAQAATESSRDEEHSLLDEHIAAFRFDGPLFFGVAHTALVELSELSTIRVAVLRLSHVTSLDATGASVLTGTIHDLQHRGITVFVSGLPQRFLPLLEATGIAEELRINGSLFDSTPAAIERAREVVAAS